MDIKREYCYDIYGLSEHRDKETIEKFLETFADREKIEPRKGDTITVIPNIAYQQRDQLFEEFSPRRRFDHIRHRSHQEKPKGKIPKLKFIKIDTLTQAIQAAISKPDSVSSIYIRNYTRRDTKCLILHFTLDQKVIFGVSVAEKDQQGNDNLPLAKKIQKEMEEMLPVKLSSIQFEQYPYDNEADFISSKQRWEENIQQQGLDEESHEWYKRRALNGDIRFEKQGFYYDAYRHRRHQQYRMMRGKVIYAINQSDYFTLADKQGQIANIIHKTGEIKLSRDVRDLQAKDATQLHYLGSLLKEALRWESKGFLPSHVLKVSLPTLKGVEHIRKGHWDGVSHMTSYEGVRSTEFIIEDTYALDSLEDIKRLADEGFFRSGESFFIYTGNTRAYEEWLVKNNLAELYLALLHDEELALKANPVTLLHLVGMHDWQNFLSYLHEFEPSEEDTIQLVRTISRKIELSSSQILDILELVEVPDFMLNTLIDNATRKGQFDLFQVLIAKAKETPELEDIASEVKNLLNKPPARADEFIRFYLDLIERKYKTFYDEEILRLLAVSDDKQELLDAILKLMPKEQWHSLLLLSYALSTENERLLDQLTFSQEEIKSFKQKQTKLAKAIKREEYRQFIVEVVKEGRFFQAEYFTTKLDAKDLVSAMLEACKRGMTGMVRLLVEKGGVPADCWFNFPVKYANQKKYKRLKEYLLSKGVKDEVFEGKKGDAF